MDYLKLLEHSYSTEKETGEYLTGTRFEFLSKNIFDFVTYDSVMSDIFGQKAVEVCKAITERKTFEYQKNEEGYKWFLIMCNMPFFVGKLEWGTSVRGAWWALHGDRCFEISSCGLWNNNEQILTTMKFNKEQWDSFVQAMSTFSAITYEAQ